jgi:hypothetical protein
MSLKTVSPISPNLQKANHKPLFRHWLWQSLLLLVIAELGLLMAHQFPARYTIEMRKPEAASFLQNFYETDIDPSGGHRWSQPQADVYLLAIDAAPAVRLYIDEQLPATTLPRFLTYGLVGQSNFSTTGLKPGLNSYDLTGQAAKGFFSPAFATRDEEGYIGQLWLSGPVLSLATTAFEPKGERRQLGVVIQVVEVRAGLSTGRPGLPTLFTMLLTGVITLASWTLLGTFRLSLRQKITGELVVIVPWLAIIALGRVWLVGHTELAVIVVLLLALGLTSARFAGPFVLADARYLLTALRRPLTLRPQADKIQTPRTVNRSIASNLPQPKWSYLAVSGIALFAFGVHLFSWVLTSPPFSFDSHIFDPRLAPWSYLALTRDYDTRTFGLRFLLNLPAPVIFVLTLLVLAATFPPTNRWLAIRLEQLSNWRPLAGRKPLTVILLILLLITLVVTFCLLFRTRLDYGDYEQIVFKLDRLKQLDALPGPNNFLIWREGEILDYALHFLLWRGLYNLEWWQPAYTYTVTSALCGGLYVIIAIGIAFSLTKQRVGRILIVGLLLTTGSTLLFMGYVESYTLISLVAMAYILAAIWAFAPPVKRPISIIWPALLLGMAILLHPQAIFLGPSYLVGLLGRAGLFSRPLPHPSNGSKGTPALFRLGPTINWQKLAIEVCQSVILGGLIVGSLIFFMGFYNYSWAAWDVGRGYVGGADQSLFKPLLAARPNTYEFYPVLSSENLGFQFNLQMLIAPLSLATLAWLSATGILRLKRQWLAFALIVSGVVVFILGLTVVAGQPVTWLIALGLFLQICGLWSGRFQFNNLAGLLLGTAALYTWLFSLCWNPDLGIMDWDLLSLNSFFTTLLAGYWLVIRLGKYPDWLARVTVALLVCSTCLWFGWISYNAFFH